MLKRILVTLAGTRYSQSAIRYALELAAAHGAAITGVTCVDLERLEDVGPVPMGAGAAARELVAYREAVTRERLEEVIAELERQARAAGIPYRIARERGEPFAELIRLWRYHDLTILGLRGLFEYSLEEDPSSYVLRLLGSGLQPIFAVAEEHREVRRVLIAYDGSREAARAMKQFVSLWPFAAPELRLVAVGQLEEGADIVLADAAAYCRAHGHEPETLHLPGRPEREILAAAADWDADAIVLGGSGRGRLLRDLFGDVAVTVIRQATLPLFLSH